MGSTALEPSAQRTAAIIIAASDCEDQVSDTIAPVQPLDVGADASVLVLTTSFVVPMSIYVEARW